MANSLDIDLDTLKHMARNAPKLHEMGRLIAEAIYRIIYETAPHTVPHAYSYRDHFRIETRHFPNREGRVTYLIAERFQWRWIEFGWTQHQTGKKYRGRYIMTNALRAYGWGDSYGQGVIE